MPSLKQKTFNGMIWSSVQRFGTMAITFTSNIVLARMLSPSDYGCIAMLMIFISLADTFVDGGFGSALIQKKNPTNEDYSTIFYLNIAISIVLYGVLFCSAPLIARFYRIELLTSVLRVQGVVLLFHALSIIQQNQMKKQLRFKQLCIIEISSAIIALSLAIIAAYHGWGVWSLVVQQVSIASLHTIMYWIVGKWKPLIVFSRKSFTELFSFGGFMLLNSLISTFSNEMQGLLVGRMFNPATLGIYNQAYRLEGSAATATSSIIDQVTYPVMASLQDNKQAFIAALKRFIQVPAYLCSIVMTILLIVAKPLIILIYSEKWIESVPYFQVLCVAGVAVSLQGVAKNAIAAVGKSRILMRWNIIKRTLTILLCVLGILVGGMKGLLWSMVAGSWSVYFIDAFLVYKHVGYAFHKQVLAVLPSFISSFLIGFVAYNLGGLLQLNMYIVAAIQAVFCVSIYILVSWVFHFEAFGFIYEMLLSKLKKK